jgi:uncharacterized membrane protein
MTNKNMFYTILPIVTVVIAVIVAILAFALPMDKLSTVILISRFFEIMLPILAVGALIKYLFCCGYRE